ncbi:MAG TPA: tetratricopeptide repeat protein [Sphingomicrobium sp.]|nr:tetratricopeptide repeat protein [Sphingomicrobium sp.]
MTHPLHLAAAATIVFSVAANAAVITVGGGYAQSCSLAAGAQDAGRQAMDSCNRALTEEALTPEERVATLVNRGILHLRRVNLREANADFDAALRLDQAEPEAWLNKAIVHARFGNATNALPLVQKALQLKTRRPALAYFVRAMALEDSGNIPGAYRDLRRAQALEPGWKEPEIELRRFKVGQL